MWRWFTATELQSQEWAQDVLHNRRRDLTSKVALQSAFSFEPERSPLILRWFASDSFGEQVYACVLLLLNHSEKATQKSIIYHWSFDLDFHNSGLLEIWQALDPFCAWLLSGKKKKKMESTSFSALSHSGLPPDDLWCFDFCYYEGADLEMVGIFVKLRVKNEDISRSSVFHSNLFPSKANVLPCTS